MSAFPNSDKEKSQLAFPPTVTSATDPGKRNILRKGERRGGPSSTRKFGAANAVIDDGSLDAEADALEYDEPEYDPEYEGFEAPANVVDLGTLLEKRVPKKLLRIPSDGLNENPAPFSVPSDRLVAKSQITLSSYKTAIAPIIKEYLSTGEIEEALVSVENIRETAYTFEFVKRSISASFDANDRERERVSRLLSAGYPKTFSSFAIGKAFERLFEQAEELAIDCPTSFELLSTFLARAVVDEILPPSFLTDPVTMNLGGEIVEHAKRMLIITTGPQGADMERIWGPGDGRPVEDMKQAVDQLLLEYLASADLGEALRCVKELNSPEFMHEVVKRALTSVVDKSDEAQQAMSNLFIYLAEEDVLSEQQASKGFRRVHDRLDDLVLDCPTAGATLAMFTAWAVEEKILPADFKYTV